QDHLGALEPEAERELAKSARGDLVRTTRTRAEERDAIEGADEPQIAGRCARAVRAKQTPAPGPWPRDRFDWGASLSHRLRRRVGLDLVLSCADGRASVNGIHGRRRGKSAAMRDAARPSQSGIRLGRGGGRRRMPRAAATMRPASLPTS